MLIIDLLFISHADAVFALHENYLPNRGWTYKAIEDALTSNRHVCLGAFEGDLLIGFLIGTNFLEESAEILSLAVSSAARRQGIGKSLITHFSKHVSKPIFLEVAASNQGAQNLYMHMGFQKIGERPNYYQTSGVLDDAYVYNL